MNIIHINNNIIYYESDSKTKDGLLYYKNLWDDGNKKSIYIEYNIHEEIIFSI